MWRKQENLFRLWLGSFFRKIKVTKAGLHNPYSPFDDDDVAELVCLVTPELLRLIDRMRNADNLMTLVVIVELDSLVFLRVRPAGLRVEHRVECGYFLICVRQGISLYEKLHDIVETEAQKDFMKLAFLENPKTPLGKIVSEAWKRFKKWWDEHKRQGVEQRTRESVLGKLAKFKSQIAEDKNERQSRGKRRDGYSI